MSRVANKLRRVTAELKSRMHRAPGGRSIVFIKPCYWVLDTLTKNSVVLDFGLGYNADFSMAMIERYGLTAHGFDPTRKHAPGLKQLADKSAGRFIYHADAIGPEKGSCTFHESKQNVSGSMMGGHHNVRHDQIESYNVNVITLADAIAIAPGGRVDLVKMDIEGSECAALDGTTDELLRSVPQWIIEFHHETIDGVTYAQTKQYIQRFERLGFRTYSRDSTDFLFYRANATGK